MEHAEYQRIVPGADMAVMFVHGILGTPNHFRDLIPLVQRVPESWSVYNVLLHGHGGDVDDFADSSMEKWRQQVRNVFEELIRSHDQVILIAHSMGTLFALQLGVEYADRIPFLFLLGVPLRPHMRPGMIRDCLRMVFGKLPPDSVLWKATSITVSRKLWKYIRWIPRYLELFREIAATQKVMKQLRVPCDAYQSGKDELVSNLTTRVLERSGVMTVHWLPNSTHFSYTEPDAEQICADLSTKFHEKSHD